MARLDSARARRMGSERDRSSAPVDRRGLGPGRRARREPPARRRIVDRSEDDRRDGRATARAARPPRHYGARRGSRIARRRPVRALAHRRARRDADRALRSTSGANRARSPGPAPGRPCAARDPKPLWLVAHRERRVTHVIEQGTVFARYRVDSMVGRGGMGVVYRATDLSLERPVALKLIAPEFAGDKRFRDRFLKEPRMAASLDHPNVVPIYEAGEHDGQLYLAMRYVEGRDLKTVLERDGKLPPDRAIAILAQVASALDAAHRRGLVHRDVKPANVLLDEDRHVYLTDFGITKQLGRASTDTGQMVGTLDYLAPEQIRGESVDERTDCYSLACVLYECLSGTPPFHRQTEAETMWAHMQELPAPLRAYPALDPVFQRALAKDRDERQRTCSEVIEDARNALGVQRPIGEVFAPARLVNRRRAIFAGGAVLLVSALVAGVIALTGGDDPEA